MYIATISADSSSNTGLRPSSTDYTSLARTGSTTVTSR